MKIKFGLLTIAALFFLASCGGTKTETAKTETDTETHEGHNHDAEDHSNSGEAIVESYTVDTAASSIKWKAEKVFSDGHFGSVDVNEGSIEMTNEALSGGSFVVGMTNISVEDMEKGKSRTKLEAHLTGTQEKGADDFFNTTVYPTSSLKITEVVKGDEGYSVTADLTIKDKTLPVTFPATITETENGIIANGTIDVNRIDYGITYNSSGLAKKVADEYLIKDIFKLEVNLVANK